MSDVDVEEILQQENDDIFLDVLPAIIFIGILMVLGFFGNALVCYVYMFRFKPSTLRCFIIALAAVDTVICAFDIPIRILVLKYKFTFGRYRNLCKVFYLGHDFLFLTSMYILISVAVERFKKVCQPLRNQMTILTAKVTVAVCFSIGFLFGLPAAFKYGTKTIRTSTANVTGKQCYRDDYHDKILVEANYIFWIITNIGVLTTLVVLYSLIWRKVAKQLKFMNKHRVARSKGSADRSVENSSESADFESDNELRVPQKLPLSDRKSNSQRQVVVSDNSSDNKISTLARKASAWLVEDKRQQGIRKMTIVMSLVTLVSFFAYLPVVTKMFVQLTGSLAFSDFKISAPWLYNIYVHTYYVQCAMNPLIYSFRNTKFRYELKRLLIRKGPTLQSSTT